MTIDRTRYIGSSDARHIISGDYLRVYKEKMGLAPPFEPSFAMQLGLLVEEFHLDWTINQLNEQVGGGYKFSKHVDPQHTPGEDAPIAAVQHYAEFTATDYEHQPVLGSHPDALGRDLHGNVFPIEVKITGRFRNTEEAADFYMPQIQHHLLCWNAERLLFSVICGTNEPERIWIGYSEQWRQHYLERCNVLWHHIKAEIPPAPLMTDLDRATVPKPIANTVPFDGMTQREMTGSNRWKAISAEFLETKEAVARHDKAKADLKGMMGDDERRIYDDQLELKRDKRGAIRINILKKEKAA